MSQNQIQFQHGMSLSEFIDTYGTEAKCEAALERARWPTGFVCPECGVREHSRFLADGRRYWQCARCRAQSTVRSGTLFHASKLPLTQWFQAIYLVTQNKNNISALSLKRHLGVAYATAWRVKHKLLEAMAQRESARLLRGVVVADDAVLGGQKASSSNRAGLCLRRQGGGAELLHPPGGLFKHFNNAREDSPDRQRLRSEIDALAAGVSVQG